MTPQTRDVSAPFARALRRGRAALAFSTLLASMSGHGSVLAQKSEPDWPGMFEVAPNFTIEVDTTGYRFPAAIAFVPNPGEGPDAPLYFVTELRGTLKVVTRDRSVHTFAKDFFHLKEMQPLSEDIRLPEMGMAGLGLAPEQGYVFVSYSYHDARGDIRFNVARFASTPGSFGLESKDFVAFTDVFSDQPGDDSHMIGPVTPYQGYLYVNVGDAHTPKLTQDLDSVLGKILRMTFDGDPVPENPFFQDSDRRKPRNYVWARGFRNPFGLAIVDGEFFATDVGPSVDRFVRVEPGQNYGYDGTDWSISSHADVAFAPSVSPVNLVFHPRDAGPLPQPYRGKFFMTTSGDQSQSGPSTHGDKAILMLDYDFERREVIGRPRIVAQYRDDKGLMLVGLATGADGLYFVCLSRDRSITTPVLKLKYDPSNSFPNKIQTVDEVIERYGCMGCHRGSGSPGPVLATEELVPRLLARLESDEYEAQVAAIDKLSDEPFASYGEARQAVRSASGVAKVRTWIKYRLLEPRFDTQHAAMPKLGLSTGDAELIAAHLTHVPELTAIDRLKMFLASQIPKPRQRHLLLFLLAGLVIGSTVTLAGVFALGRYKRWSLERKARSRPRENSEGRAPKT